ncbi:MAG: hypothetical protein V4640_16170 [Verrucomicrobiota bacterium]
MNASKILKLAVIAEIALIPLGIAVSYWADRFLPEEALALVENQSLAFSTEEPMSSSTILILAASIPMLGVWIASWVGLFKLKRWGAWLYLISTLSALPLYLLFGIDVRHPIDQIFDSIYGFIPGLIIGLAFFSNAIPHQTRELTPQE